MVLNRIHDKINGLLEGALRFYKFEFSKSYEDNVDIPANHMIISLIFAEQNVVAS